MAKHTHTSKSRRSFLKGTAALSALSIGSFSGTSFANTIIPGATDISKKSPISQRIMGDSGIRIVQETQFDREKVTLINESGRLQMLDARQPVSLYQVNGALVVTVNQDDNKAVNGMIVMSPDQQLTFDVKAIGIELDDPIDIPALTNLAENQLQISSTHSTFNRVVPVQIA